MNEDTQGLPRLDVYDASVPIYYGQATLINGTAVEAYFDGSNQQFGSITIKAANLPTNCGRYRVATIQVVADDSLNTQLTYAFEVEAFGRYLNKGGFFASSGTMNYPGWLLPDGWDQIIRIPRSNITAALSGTVHVIFGIVRVDQRPGAH